MKLKQNRIVTVLVIVLSISFAIVSYCGVFIPATYARDSISMGVQGMGQDIVDLFFVLPLLTLSFLFTLKDSKNASFIFTGIIFYISYSFVIYSFGVHFNDLFLLYCIILGSSFYLFILMVINLNSMEIENWFSENVPLKSIAVFLIIIAVMFYLLWLKDIIPAILDNEIPKTISENNLQVNPVHVLDISIALPGLIVTSVLLLKKQKIGFILAPVLLVFIIILAIALIAMVIMLKIKGLESDLSVTVIFAVLSFISSFLLLKYFKEMQSR